MFDINCCQCPRLLAYLDEIGQEYPDYHARPVDAFGAKKSKLLIVGLAPGMHGANATGRPFTGDASGELLFRTLYDQGFSSKPVSVAANDGLTLNNCRITNAVKCLPPQNKPTTAEIKTCNSFLRQELATLKRGAVVLALGAVAHSAVLRAYGLTIKQYKFGHGAQYILPNQLWLLDSYHCSRYNTQTKRLTPEMLQSVFAQAKILMGSAPDSL